MYQNKQYLSFDHIVYCNCLKQLIHDTIYICTYYIYSYMNYLPIYQNPSTIGTFYGRNMSSIPLCKRKTPDPPYCHDNLAFTCNLPAPNLRNVQEASPIIGTMSKYYNQPFQYPTNVMNCSIGSYQNSENLSMQTPSINHFDIAFSNLEQLIKTLGRLSLIHI